MKKYNCIELASIPPFPENGSPVAVPVPPPLMQNFPFANPEENLNQESNS